MKTLSELESLKLLKEWRVPVIESILVQTVDEALAAATRVGYPLVLKVHSDQISHKTDAGGVKLGISNESMLRSAWDEVLHNVTQRMPSAIVRGMLVQRMARKGTEVIIGGTRDPFFGPVVMFGLGGVFTEIFEDTSFRLAPVTLEQAIDMIHETRAYRLLMGARNTPPADIGSVAEVIVNVSKLMKENEQVVELDINPLIVYPRDQGCVAVDGLVAIIDK